MKVQVPRKHQHTRGEESVPQAEAAKSKIVRVHEHVLPQVLKIIADYRLDQKLKQIKKGSK